MASFETALDKENPPDGETRQAFLDEAIEAVRNGDIKSGLQALYLGHILDGVFRNLQKQWGGLSDDEIYDALSQSIVQMFERVTEGVQILRPIPYLLKVSNGKLSDRWRENKRISATEIQTLPEQDPVSKSDRTKLKKEALSIARGFLSQLGQENVQLVMEYIFDALARGVEDISNAEIGEALSLSPDVIRQSKSRGWSRLERIAKQNGYHLEFRFIKEEDHSEVGEEDE